MLLSSLAKATGDEESEKSGVETSFSVQKTEGEIFFHCSICNKDFKLGAANKKMQNIKIHILSRTHNLKVQEKIQKAGGQMAVQTGMVFKDFQEAFGTETFLLKGTSAYCRCCNISINLASRGDPLFRGRAHVKSQEHITNQAKLQMHKTKDISSFFSKIGNPTQSKPGTGETA